MGAFQSKALRYQLQRLPDDGTCGVPKHVGELTRCGGYISCI